MRKTITQFIRKQVLLGLVMVLSLLVAKAQVSVTATSGTTGPTSYTTVNAAFAAINAGTHQGAITITVTASTTETAPATQLLSSGTGSALYTSVLITPQGNVTINSAATPTASRGVLEFIGADYITIDGDDPLTPGDKNLTIQVATTTNGGTACLRFSSTSTTANGCTNVTVKNCNFIGGRSSSTSTTTSFGIFSGLSTAAATITTASGAADNDSMLIENNTFTKLYYGIYCYGLTGYVQDYLRIRNNTIGSSSSPLNNVCFRGIYTANTQLTPTANSVLIEGNDVQGGEQTSGISTSIAGIELNVGSSGAVVRNNNIHDVKNPSTGGWGCYGIMLGSATNSAGIMIYNNFIRDITAFHYLSSATTFTNYGIYSAAAVTGVRILHNTIVLNQPNAGSGTANFSSCVYFSSTTANVAECRNNIFVNNQSDNTGQACLNVYLGAATIFSGGTAINKNNYWVSGASGYAGRIGTTNYQTLNAWRTITTKDSNSLNFNPTFVSSTDIHLPNGGSSPFESSGDLTWVTTDIDGQTRPGPTGSVNGGGTSPDIGADEADMGLPSIATMATGGYTNVTTSAATLAGSIVTNGGSNITASGIVISTSPAPTRGSGGVIDSATNPLVNSGSFSVNIAGLTNGTTYYYRSYGVNAIGTAYGPDSTFTTNAAAVVPTVLRTAATAITGFTATAGGNITSDGGSPVTASGIVYGTSPNPTIGTPGVIDSTTSPVVSAGSFTRNLGGMTHSTKYYFRAYATNAVGTGYSVQDSFTTQLVVTSLPYSENFDGATTPWAASAINTGTNSWVRGTPAKTFINGAFSAPNAFVTTLTGTYVGTEDCVVLSPQMDFTGQVGNPVLRFKHKMDVDADLGWDGGVVEISINGGAWTRLDPIAGAGGNFNTANSTAWYNSTSASGTLGAPKWSVNTGTSYSSQVSGWITSSTPLTGAAGQSNVRVRFRFWADGLVDEGWAIDDIEVFAPTTPTVVTGTKTNVTTSAANLSGNITNNGGSAITASGIVLSTSPNPTRGTPGVVDSATNPLATAGAFTVSVTGLSSATTYYYRSYAVNVLGTSYGADSTFTTNAAAVVPTVTLTAASGITAFTANTGGNITSDGGSAVTASGIVYSTSPNPTLGALGVVDSTTNPLVALGSFTSGLGGLAHSTKYYIRAYATNAVGTAYSAEDSFTTQIVVSVLPYSENFDGATTPWTAAAINAGTSSWTRGTPAKVFINGAYSAPNAFVTNLTGNYVGTEDCVVLSPQMDFSSQVNTPVLRFKHKMDVDADIGWDGGVAEISINGGAWTRLDAVAGTGGNFNTANSTAWYNNAAANGTLGAPKWSVNTGTSYSSQVSGWITSTTPLTGAAGQSNVRVRFRFWADAVGIDEGWALDDIEVFIPTTPTTATAGKSNITTSNATLSGTISSNGGSNVTASGIVFSTSPNPTRGTPGVVDSATNPLVSSGNFSVNVSGLTSATTYYYRSYAVNAIGTSYGADSTFTTNAAAVVPTIVTVTASNRTTASATVGGNIISDGGAVVTASGVVYSSSNNLPALGGLGVVDSTTTPLVALGAFSLNPTGLTHSTKYYFRAYATNSAGTAYGALDSFTTLPIISSFPYTENFDGASTPWTSTTVNTGTNSWVLGTPAKVNLNGAYSAPNAFVTRLTGSYLGTEDCAVLSPQFDFSALTADPVLRFRHKMDVDADLGWDGGVIEMSINGGAWNRVDAIQGTGGNFNTTYSYSWYNDVSVNGVLGVNKFSVNTATTYSSQASGWIESATRLTGAAGQSNVRFRFRFWADGLVDEGWAIDNIEVVNIVAPTVAASNVSATPAATSANITFSPGNGAGRLVVARLASATAVAPVDSVLYTANTAFGSGNTTGTGNFVVYVGNGTSVNITGLLASTAYAFDVYEYNGRYMHNRFTAAANGTTTTTPVKLISFAGVKADNDAQLTWVTASERNNKGFFVERSTDGARYEAIGFVAGKGNSNNKVNYTFTDVNVFAGNDKVYYRLQQVDENGMTTYSGVVFITSNEALATEVSAYPNPFRSDLNLSIYALQSGKATVEVMDISGRKINSFVRDVKEGSNALPVSELTSLGKGVYLIQVKVDGTTKVMKLVKE